MADGYRNPVLPGFHPDPSVCRFGDDFLLVTSSFTWFPGVPIFRSPDLVSWEQLGDVLDRTSQLDLRGSEASTSAGIYAPTLRCHDGRLWMITTTLTDRGLGLFLVTAEDPAGPWTEPLRIDIAAIDPDIAWDDEGTCWVHAALGQILRFRIDERTGEVLEGPEPTWSGTGLAFPEAPHLLRRGDWWYLLIAEGGTERGHAASIARGPSPTGPWESCPANPIISHRSTDRPIQNTGHADLVQAPDGSWWMVLLGTRPAGTTPRFHGLGRETFLVPVDWVDGWPVPRPLELDVPTPPTGAGDVPVPTFAVDEGFDGGELPPGWVSVRGPLGERASLTDRPGSLVLRGDERDLDDPWPCFLGRRQQHLACVARTTVEVDGAAEAGLGIRMDERHHAEVAVAGGEVVVRARVGDVASVVARRPVPPGPVTLLIECRDGKDDVGATGAPDRLRMGVEVDGRFEVLADLDGRYLTTEVAGGFTGRVIGLYAVHGTAAFDDFELGPL